MSRSTTSQGPLTPLHVRSGYSMLRGPTPVDRLIECARRLGHEALALTDVDGLYGATRFYREALAAGLRPIIGAELHSGGLAAVALVDSAPGYENLCRIITEKKGSGAFSAERTCGKETDDPPAEKVPDPFFSDGLQIIVEDAASAAALLAAGVERERLWVGVDPASQSPGRLHGLAGCARELALPLVATGKALMAEAGEYPTARLLAAIRTGTTYANVPADELPHPGATLRPAGEVLARLGDFPEAVRNNRRLVERCQYQLLPRRPVFPAFPCPGGLSPVAYLRRLCEEGMRRRYGAHRPAARRRMEEELALIRRMGLAEYFLVVWDIVQYARSRGAPVAGRGSGASSLVAYLLRITNVCPLAFDIPFERFLNPGRSDFPDLDIDFCWRIRDDVIDYAFRRWGAGRVAMVCTHITFQPRSARREAAKAFGESDEQITAGQEEKGSGAFSVEPPRQKSAGRPAEKAPDPFSLVGLPHHLSVHPGGIVIAPDGVDRHVPLERAAKGVMITQYDKRGVEDIGLVKLDLLGNRALSTIHAACRLIAGRGGPEIDVEDLPPDDPATVRTLRRADTVGCNQLESPAMRHLLRALRPAGATDVMKALALIRPGAASIGMKDVFIRRHRAEKAEKGSGPFSVEPPRRKNADRPAEKGPDPFSFSLAGTCGVLLYEDDVMRVAAAMMGSTLEEGDRFRKAIQKCRDDAERLDLSRRFLAAARARGVPEDYARQMWVQMAKFNAYSFCRAHSASYAAGACAVAYLKTHHPLEFWVAALNNNQSMYHPRVYVEQAKRASIRFLLPEVNRSEAEFSIDGGAVRVGLGMVAEVGPATVEAILAARRSGPFEGLSDCLARTGIGREEAAALVRCGAFDAFGRCRPELMMELELATGEKRGQTTFLPQGGRLPSLRLPRRQKSSLSPFLLPAMPRVPRAPTDYSPRRKYAEERAALGISVGEHIMSLYRPALAGLVDADSRALTAGNVGRRVRIAGVLEAFRATRSAGGKEMGFLTLDDESGLFEATVFPGAFRRRPSLARYGPYIVAGRVEEQYDTVTVSADRISLHEVQP